MVIGNLAFAAGETGLSVSAVGDVMMGSLYPTARLPEDQGRGYFKDATSLFKSTDIRFANFEGTFFEGSPQPDGKKPGPNRYLFQTPLDYVARLVEAGINVVSLANNHARDFGQKGFESTRQTLALAGIKSSSKTGGDVAGFEIRGLKVSMIAVDYYTGARSIVSSGPTLAEIAELKKTSDIVIVSGHVGREGAGAERVSDEEEIYLGENRGNSIRFARQAVDQGADLILFHGPHVPRGMEIYRGRLIVYSLGNFATGQGILIDGIAGLAPLVRIKLDTQGRFTGGHLTSLIQTRPEAVILDKDKRALKLMDQLSKLDFPHSAPSFDAEGNFR